MAGFKFVIEKNAAMAAAASIMSLCRSADYYLPSAIGGSTELSSRYADLKGMLAQVGREAVDLASKIKNTDIG